MSISGRRWRLEDLVHRVWEEDRISVSIPTMSRVLREIGYRKLTARPRHHGQNGDAIDAFKKNFPAEIARLHARIGPAVPLDIWWQDEARVGQKNNMLGRTGHTACGTKRPAHKIRLDIRGDLPGPGCGGRACPAAL